MKVFLFACIEKNIGDDLFVKLLCERYPHVEFIISSQARYGSLERIPNLTFSDTLKKWGELSTRGSKNKLKALAAKLLQSCCRLALPRCDVGVSIVGNAFKNKEYTGWKQSRWIRDRIRLVKRFYLISTNFGPYSDERWRNDFDRIFPKMADVCFRDRYSYGLFSRHSNIRFAPDAVISMGKKKGAENDPKNVIISLIDCSFHARSEELRRACPGYEQKMCELTDKLVELGYSVTLLNSNTLQDKPACDRIVEKCVSGRSGKITVVNYDGDLDVISTLYENSSFVVATRLHTIVLAWLYGLPVVPVVYDIKVGNLLDACGFGGARFMIDSPADYGSEEILTAVKDYDFTLSQETVSLAQEQFSALDQELGNNN